MENSEKGASFDAEKSLLVQAAVAFFIAPGLKGLSPLSAFMGDGETAMQNRNDEMRYIAESRNELIVW